MVKSITVAIVAVLFFSAGQFAGYGVQFSETVDRPKNLPTTGEADRSGTVCDVSKTATEADDVDPVSFVSNSTPSPVPNMRSAAQQQENAREQSRAHRAAVQSLILQHFPDTTPELAGIWTETYAGMDLEEIEFILQQKREISTALAPDVNSSVLQKPTTTEPFGSRPDFFATSPIHIVQKNLHSAFALGFRRMVVFPETINTTESISPNKPGNVLATTFRSFECGPLIPSPIPTHAALSKPNGFMFVLDDSRLTRRGDFRLLQDRRLGLVTQLGELAVSGSTPIPENATEIKIGTDGTIHFQNASGETRDAGRISVCCVIDLAQLQSEDGVFFHLSDVVSQTIVQNITDVLVTNALEQSNVDRAYEDSLLTHLTSL